MPMTKLRGATVALGMSVVLALMPVSLSGQGQNRPATARPWPPARTADGQPNVEGNHFPEWDDIYARELAPKSK